MAFHRRADDGPFTVVFGSSLPSSTEKRDKKKKKKKNVVKVEASLTKLSGSAYGNHLAEEERAGCLTFISINDICG